MVRFYTKTFVILDENCIFFEKFLRDSGMKERDTEVCTVDSKYYQIISNIIISSCKGL
jgi:hypothetical protein